MMPPLSQRSSTICQDFNWLVYRPKINMRPRQGISTSTTTARWRHRRHLSSTALLEPLVAALSIAAMRGTRDGSVMLDQSVFRRIHGRRVIDMKLLSVVDLLQNRLLWFMLLIRRRETMLLRAGSFIGPASSCSARYFICILYRICNQHGSPVSSVVYVFH